MIVGDDLQLYTSAIVLAGGFSSRFGQDKGLIQLANRPLVAHVLDAVSEIANERLIVASSKSQARKYSKLVDSIVRVEVDEADVQSPLAGALTGFGKANGEYSLLLPCDTPLVSTEILSLLLELSLNKSAAIPRWPNTHIEPLQAAYRTQAAFQAANSALKAGELDLQAMVSRLANVRYVSTLVLRQLDPELQTFFNINTPFDLRKAELFLKKRFGSRKRRLR